MYKTVICFALLTGLLVSCGQTGEQAQPSRKSIHAVLDDWHNAAAEADFERYFSHFASDSAIFMGTDGSERWTIAEFKPWSKPYFDRGEAWSFVPVERHIYFGDNGEIAWFDESLDTPQSRDGCTCTSRYHLEDSTLQPFHPDSECHC